MAIYPAAHVDLLTKGSPTALTRVDGYVAHTIVGSAASAINLFKGNGYGGSTAHFVMDFAGKVTQLVDTKHRANCQVDGNWRLLSCEHADYGEGFPTWNLNDGSQVPAFTAAQVDAEIELQVWMAKTHGFPVWLMESSMSTEKGIGWHKLGVNPFRVAGSEVWSSSYGKQCPGSRRIDQLKNVIFPEVRRRVNPPPTPPTPNVPSTPTPKQEDDMPYRDWPQADKNALINDIMNADYPIPATATEKAPKNNLKDLIWRAARMETHAVTSEQITAAVAAGMKANPPQ